MLVLVAGLLMPLVFAGALLREGIMGGLVREHMRGGTSRSGGWSGADAAAMGWFLVFIGIAILCFALSLGVILARGGDYMVEWDSLPGFLATVPLFGAFVAAGAVLLLHAWRGRARWALVPGAGAVLMGLIGCFRAAMGGGRRSGPLAVKRVAFRGFGSHRGAEAGSPASNVVPSAPCTGRVER